MQIEFADVDGIDLPESKRFNLSDGMVLLQRQNEDLLTNGELGSVAYQLYYDEQQALPVYQDELELPLEEIDLISIIKNDLVSDGEELSPDIQQFLSALSQELNGKNKKVKLPPLPKTTKKVKREPKPEPEPQAIELEPIETPKREPVPPINKRKKSATPKNTNKNSSIRISKRHLFYIGVFFIVLIVGAGCFKYFSSTSADEKTSYDELIKKGYYLEAGKEYPNKKKAIEQILYDQTVDSKNSKTKETLIQFQEVYPTAYGEFDLSILDNDYSKALKEYETNKKTFEGNQDRLVLVGYCYLKEDKLDDAKTIVDKTNSTELERYVYKYEQLQSEITTLEKQLKELKKDPVGNRDDIEKSMNELFDAKEELLNL